VQVIRENNTKKLFLIEINPRFATTINLTISSGVHIPKMLIENDFTPKYFENGLTMVRDYKEYFKLSNKRIFITGGAGFIGSNVIKHLLYDTDHYITIYDNLSTVDCGLRNIEKYLNDERVTLIQGDILNKSMLFESMNGHDIVIHLAAQLEITSAYKDPLYDLNVNLIGTINVIEGCIKNNIKRLINASSACVYGNTYGNASKETDQTNPNWEYGVSKLSAEKYIQIASDTHGLNYTSLRFSIVYGENEWFGRVLTIFAKRAIENKDLVIFGDGNQTRDYINVNDVSRFVLECINNINTHNKIYNVSSGKSISILELAHYVKKIYPTVSIIYDNVKEGEVSKILDGRERLKNELTHLYLDNTKAMNETGWKPTVDFDTGIKNYFEWVKLNNWTNRYKV
jgi:nucleoside-diphosphate-sugar epimerase